MTCRRTFDKYDSIASEVMTIAATGGQTLETMEEIADFLRSTFPPSDLAPAALEASQKGDTP